MGVSNKEFLFIIRSMESTLVPLTNNNISVLVVNSNVKHELTGSEYSQRRKHCHQAASILNVKSLRDANEKLLAGINL